MVPPVRASKAAAEVEDISIIEKENGNNNSRRSEADKGQVKRPRPRAVDGSIAQAARLGT